MIPTLIVFGLIFGRWWRISLVIAAAGWPIVLVATDATGLEWVLLSAAGLAAVNALAGVVLHQSALVAVRWLRRRPSARAG